MIGKVSAERSEDEKLKSDEEEIDETENLFHKNEKLGLDITEEYDEKDESNQIEKTPTKDLFHKKHMNDQLYLPSLRKYAREVFYNKSYNQRQQEYVSELLLYQLRSTSGLHLINAPDRNKNGTHR